MAAADAAPAAAATTPPAPAVATAVELQPPGFPVSVKAATAVIAGHPTDLVASNYADGTLLVVSQIGAFGTVVRARPDASQEGRTTYTTQVLLGRRDEPLLTLAARQLIELAAAGGSSSPLTVTLGLREHSMAAVKELVAAVRDAGLLA